MGKYGVSIKWLAVSSFEIKYKNTTIVTDPYITECVGTDVTWEAVENCDIICVGHSHWDHITDIPRLVEKFHPRILCGEMTAMPMVKWLNVTPTDVYPMAPNLELDFGEVKVRALFGRHKNLKRGFNDLMEYLDQNPLCKSDPGIAALQGVGSLEYRNYLFTFENGTKILIWGNAPRIELLNICKELKPDIAILQRPNSERLYDWMSEFAREIGCEIVIPHHHDFKQVDDPASINRFKEVFLEKVPGGTFVTPVHGEWIEL